MDSYNLNWSLEYYEENTKECDIILNSPENRQKIPQVNSMPFHNFSDGTLVRYQGMVQDMLNPEYYSSTYTVVNKENKSTYVKSGKFRDFTYCKTTEEVQLKDVNFTPKERLVFFCIPFPGTNSWVRDYERKHDVHERNKQHCSSLKREASDGDEEMETDNVASPLQCSTKRNRTTQVGNQVGSTNQTYNTSKYFPFPDENGFPCIVKVYEDEEKSGIVLNDRIEVVGFLSLNPALEAIWEDSDVEDKALHPPPSLVPRIHAIHIRKLKHCNPLLPQIISYGDIGHTVESSRNYLHLILTQILFEDTIAADYLLCHLLSKIYIRNESHTIGKLSLNLFNIDLKNFGACLSDILGLLVTNSHYVPLSTQLLNETSFIPKKDYDSNRLWSGMLQLCEDTHIILDETKMNEGQLNNTGCLNVSALQRLFRDQEIQYDFGYYPVTYTADVPLLVLSEGKSMFEADVRLKLAPNSCTESSLTESFEAVRAYLNEDVSSKIRIYLTSMRLREFELGEEMVHKIGEDYVLMRQEDKKVSSSDLHTLLILSRLLALSHGRTFLSPEDWKHAVRMETERKLRLS